MSIPTYTLGYPPDGSSLGETKVVIRNNLDGTFETLEVDHVNNNGEAKSAPLTGNPAGYHTIIHQVTQAAKPAAIPGVNQVFAMIPPSNIPPGTDPQLFNLTGNGGFSQMTGDFSTENGYVWCAGILLQWGKVTGLASGTPVNFNVPFPTAFFNIQLTALGNISYVVKIGSTTPIQASFIPLIFNTSAVPTTGSFYWFAIGN